MAEEIAGALGLGDAERWELLRLVDEAASAPSAADPPTASVRAAPTLQRWYVKAIAELARCDRYVPDPEWVAAVLRPRIETCEAAEALRLLRDLGVLDDEFRRIASPSAAIEDTSDREGGQVSKLWGLALREVPPSARRHFTSGVALSEEGFERFGIAMRRCFDDLLAAARSSPPGDAGPAPRPNRVYLVGLTTFPVTLYSDSAAHPSEVED